MASHTLGVINAKPSFAKVGYSLQNSSPRMAQLTSDFMKQVAAMAPPPKSSVIPSGQQPAPATNIPNSPGKPAQVNREPPTAPLPKVVDSSTGLAGEHDKAQPVIQGIEKLALAESQSSKKQPQTLQDREVI